jgi:rubrerythrin
MAKNYLSDISNKENELELKNKVSRDIEKIKDLRLEVGYLIQEYIHTKNYTKTKVFEILSEDKTIKSSQLKSMIDESYFHKKYQPAIKLEKFEINKLNHYFNKNSITQEQRKEILLNESSIYDVFDKIQNQEDKKEKRIKHSFEFDEEAEQLLKNGIKILEKQFARKVTLSECLMLSLMELVSTYPEIVDFNEEDLEF